MLTFPIIIYFHFLIDWQNMHRQTAIQNMYKKFPNSPDYASHRQENDKECDETHWKYTSKCICTYRDKEEGASVLLIDTKENSSRRRSSDLSIDIHIRVYIHIYMCMYTLYQESNWIAFQCNEMQQKVNGTKPSSVEYNFVFCTDPLTPSPVVPTEFCFEALDDRFYSRCHRIRG